MSTRVLALLLASTLGAMSVVSMLMATELKAVTAERDDYKAKYESVATADKSKVCTAWLFNSNILAARKRVCKGRK